MKIQRVKNINLSQSLFLFVIVLFIISAVTIILSLQQSIWYNSLEVDMNTIGRVKNLKCGGAKEGRNKEYINKTTTNLFLLSDKSYCSPCPLESSFKSIDTMIICVYCLLPSLWSIMSYHQSYPVEAKVPHLYLTGLSRSPSVFPLTLQ
ncbi:MAG: hypothetical protein ACI8RD_006240 [Bacillariaceae sp.]|jgi:hypothetical protein